MLQICSTYRVVGLGRGSDGSLEQQLSQTDGLYELNVYVSDALPKCFKKCETFDQTLNSIFKHFRGPGQMFKNTCKPLAKHLKVLLHISRDPGKRLKQLLKLWPNIQNMFKHFRDPGKC